MQCRPPPPSVRPERACLSAVSGSQREKMPSFFRIGIICGFSMAERGIGGCSQAQGSLQSQALGTCVAWSLAPTQVSKRETKEYLNSSHNFNPSGLVEYHQVVQRVAGHVRRAMAKRDPATLPTLQERMAVLHKTLECERGGCATTSAHTLLEDMVEARAVAAAERVRSAVHAPFAQVQCVPSAEDQARLADKGEAQKWASSVNVPGLENHTHAVVLAALDSFR